jgi:hypothetical protein
VNDFTYTNGRREAQAWLAHQLTWERILGDLRARSEDEQGPVALADAFPGSDAAAA